MEAEQADRAKEKLIRAVRAILDPLVRQLIAHGVTFPAFSRLAKEVYIEVGTSDFALPFKRQTDSRVALVTGITRKEIGQIRRGQKRAPEDAGHLDYGLASRVVGRWVAEEDYLDEQGLPRDLAWEPEQEGEPSFSGLVAEVGGDIPPRAVLDELIRVGAVALTARGRIELRQRAYVPASGTEEKIAILGADASELIRAITHNIDSPAEAFLQRKVWYDNVGRDGLPEIRDRVRSAGTAFAQEINRILSTFDRDRNPDAPAGRRSRVVLGIYYLDEDYEEKGVEGSRGRGSEDGE